MKALEQIMTRILILQKTY